MPSWYVFVDLQRGISFGCTNGYYRSMREYGSCYGGLDWTGEELPESRHKVYVCHKHRGLYDVELKVNYSMDIAAWEKLDANHARSNPS